MNHISQHAPMVLTAQNVNKALYDGLWWLATAGYEEQSRNGPVLVAPGPVITHYTRPQERVLFCRTRDANPFFHIYEAMWMLAGRNDAAAVARYAATMEAFADEHGILNGAYGHRWRRHFGWDQLIAVVEELRANPQSRRVVLTMWDPGYWEPVHNYVNMGDFYKATHGSKDVPCNTHVYFGIDALGLNMTVCNRSNDMIWGGYGANYVHMGVLQEVIAAALGVPVGSYYQMSNNYHVYPERSDTKRLISLRPNGEGYDVWVNNDDRYETMPRADIYPMFSTKQFPLSGSLAIAGRLAEDPRSLAPDDPLWFREVFNPLMCAHAAYKDGYFIRAFKELERCISADWRVAAEEWLARRLSRKNAEQSNAQGV